MRARNRHGMAVGMAAIILGAAGTAAEADEVGDDALAGSTAILAINVISDRELGDHRGADSSINSHNTTTETEMNQTATNSGTLNAQNVNAGDLVVSDAAFGNFAGMHNAVMNTGSLNNLVAGMTLTIVLGE